VVTFGLFGLRFLPGTSRHWLNVSRAVMDSWM
jgi:hypothetical protein